MAGLLEGLGDFIKTPEGQGLLSAAFGGLAGARKGQPINSIGRAGLAGLSGYSGAEDRALQLKDSTVKRGYMQSQIDENVSQNAARAATMERQKAQDAYFMGAPSTRLLADAPISPGAYQTPAVDGVGPVAPMPATGTAPSMGKFDEWSSQFGIPKDALLADYRANGGKGIADMLYKRGTPDMQVNNGFAFDKNALKPGFMPSFTTTPTGQGIINQIGPNGLPISSIPQGALEAFGAYKGAEAGLKPIKVFNKDTQTEEYTTEGQVIKAANGGTPTEAGMRTQVQGGMGADPAGIQSEIAQVQKDLMKPMDEPSKAMLRAHLADLQAQGKTTPVQSGNFAAGPSLDQKATSAATQTQLESQAKDVAEQRKTIMNAGFNAPATIAKYQQIGKLLSGVDGGTLTATGTQLASAMNSIGIKIDKNLPNKEAAAALGNEMALELRNPANGAGMPGAMSDSDRNYLVSMIPSASQSAAGRAQLIEAKILMTQRNQEVAQFARNYEKKYGKLDNGFFDQMSAWSAANPLFKGK